MECYKSFAMLYVPLCLIGENGIVGGRIPSNGAVTRSVQILLNLFHPTIYLLLSIVGFRAVSFCSLNKPCFEPVRS